MLDHCCLRGSFIFSAATLVLCAFSSQVAHGAGLVAKDEATYLKENDVAMNRMMSKMSIHPSGDVDRDFVAMMIPHHQGAIDMAQSELRYGKNEQLRRIAQEIVVEQQQEIVAMHIALGQALPPPSATPDQMTSGSTATQSDLSGAAAPMHPTHRGDAPTR